MGGARLPLASAGYHVLAPDMRGYGRTTGWDDAYDGDVFMFRHTNLVRDALGLVSAFGYRSVAGVFWTRRGFTSSSLLRRDPPRCVPLGGHDDVAVCRAAGAAVQHGR